MMEEKLPKNWVKASISDVAIIKGGKRLPKGKSLTPINTGFPYIRVKDFNNFGSVDLENIQYLTKDIFEVISNYTISCNDIYISIAGTIGKSGIVPKELDGANLTENAAKLVLPKNKIEQKILFFFTQSQSFKEQTGIAVRAVAMPKLAIKRLGAVQFPLPPLPEQKRIVAKLDKLFGNLERLKTRLARIPSLLSDFRQSVLTQAVTGKLTEEWRVGKELEIVTLNENDNKDKYSILNYGSTPKSWVSTTIGNYANCSRGKFTARPRNDPQYFKDGEYPFMQIGDLPRNGGFSSGFSKTLNEKGIGVSKSFPKNTIAIAIVGATIGNTGILTKEMYFPDSLIGINSPSETSNFFLEYFLRVVKNGLREISYAGGGQPNIKLPTIRNLKIEIPSLKEQKQIVSQVASLFAKADKIESRYQSLKANIEVLPQAILAKAFRGELVEQLETDGDAKELLEEIAKLRAEMDGKKKKRRKK